MSTGPVRMLAAISTVCLGIVACSSTHGEPILSRASQPEIVDAVHNAGNSGFYFLPPLTTDPGATGTFDADLAPVVEICEWTALDCLPLDPPAVYTTASGPGSETVRVSTTDEHYVVNWHTDQFELDPTRTYRIRVSVEGTELGHADVDVVNNGSELKNVETGEFVALKDGRTLPIKFRILAGAVLVADPTGGTLTTSDGAVSMEIPEGAVGEPVAITVEQSDTTGSGLVPGTVFDFGPDGLVFNEPVILTIVYDETLLGGAEEASLQIYQILADGTLVPLASVVDEINNTISATVYHFSTYGVGVEAASVQVVPDSVTLDVGATAQLTATAFAASGESLPDAQIVFASASPAIATVSSTGLVTGTSPGETQITATSGDATGIATVAVRGTCGNGTREFGEQCDGADVGAESCTTQGYAGGTLGCTGTCTFDVSGCTNCGNGTQESSEQCDGADLGGQTCNSQGYSGGTLGCTGGCTFDLTGCTNCGDETVQSGEQCDGADLDGQTCASQGFATGTLACTSACTFDVSGCSNCGNGIIDSGEQCDGSNHGGETCQSQGYDSGVLLCRTDLCTFNYSLCATCGDGVRSSSEACEGGDLGGKTCASLGLGSGTLSCNDNCTLDVSGCSLCDNDGVRDPGEECDGTDLGGKTCLSQGYLSGTLACTDSCTFDISGCYAVCGNSFAETGEQCDGFDLGGGANQTTCEALGFGGGTLSCNPDCTFDTSSCDPCGNGVRDTGEQCDGAALGGATCNSLGLPDGTLACTSTCSFNTSDCSVPATVAGQTKISNLPDQLDGSLFGQSVAYLGEVEVTTGVFKTFVAVGAPYDATGGGAVFILLLNADGTVWSQQKIDNTLADCGLTIDPNCFELPGGDQLGWAVGSPGDLDGDGVPEVVAGAPGHYPGGAAWIFYLNPDGTVKLRDYGMLKAIKLGESTRIGKGTVGVFLPVPLGLYFGSSIASPGDLDADGVPELVIGVRGNDDGGSNRGGVYVLFLDPDFGNWVKSYQTISDTQGGFTGGLANSDLFGYSLASLGDTDGDGVGDIMVGSLGSGGALWGLRLNSDGTVKGHFKIPAPIPGELFGTSVASIGDLDGNGVVDIAAGVIGNDDVALNAGAVWLFLLNADGSLSSQQKLVNPEAAAQAEQDTFGSSVAGLGDLAGDGTLELAVGVRQDDDGGSNRGALWIFRLLVSAP